MGVFFYFYEPYGYFMAKKLKNIRCIVVEVTVLSNSTPMKAEERLKKVEALEKIKERALSMADQGADALEVRNFVQEGAKELAFALPDVDAFKKAAEAAKLFKTSVGKK
jgi:hypothetical protein